jgi:hypothetical protein
MGFLEEFLLHFTDEEQESEIVKLLSQIGTNMEIALARDIDREIRASVEFLHFSDTRLRSWLAAVLVQVREYLASSGNITLKITRTSHGVSIEKGRKLTTKTGILFEVQSNVFLVEGQEVVLRVIQGEEVTSTGTYAEIIQIPVDKVDLNYLVVKIEGTEIPQVPRVSSSVIPVNGYFAYVYNSVLWIKIYTGDTVTSPEGKEYEVTLRVCEGTLGNVPADGISAFSESLRNIDGGSVTYEITHTAFYNGKNRPSHSELVNLLRLWFFVKSNVSSVPEYTIWFLSQPEVGGCKVVSDFERWRTSGKLESTGYIDVYLIDKNGEKLTNDQLEALNDRLEAVKDIGVIRYKNFQIIKSAFVVHFLSAGDQAGFVSHIEGVISNFYNVNWCADNGYSLFEDLDIEAVRSRIDPYYSVKGLEITPYHVKEYEPRSTTILLTMYDGDSPGEGFAEVWRLRGEEYVLYETVYERIMPSGSVVLVNLLGDMIGSIDDGNYTLTYPFAPDDKFYAYWLIKNRGYLASGASDAIRELHTVKVEQYIKLVEGPLGA